MSEENRNVELKEIKYRGSCLKETRTKKLVIACTQTIIRLGQKFPACSEPNGNLFYCNKLNTFIHVDVGKHQRICQE